MFKKIIFFFISWKIITLFFAYLTTFILPLKTQFTAGKFGFGFPYLFWVWGNFDGYHYLEIAQRGYQTFEHAFFPLYPLLINILQRFLNVPYLIAGQLISNLAFLIASLFIFRLAFLDNKKSLVSMILLTVFIFPTSFFYQAIYNDSLFLLLAVLTIYFARSQKWVLASIFGSLSTLARLNGLVFFIYILFEYITSKIKNEKQTWDFKQLKEGFISELNLKEVIKSRIFFIFFIPFTFLGYLTYIQSRFGNWQLLFQNLSIWNQEKIVFPLQVFFRYIKIFLIHTPTALTYWVAVIEFLFVFFYILILIYSFKRIRLSYWIFVVISLIIPTLTGSFAGMPRYGLHLYPIFLSLAMFLDRKSCLVKLIFLTVSIALFFITLAFFTRGYFIA